MADVLMKIFLAIALTLWAIVWIICAWIAFSVDDSWSRYLKDVAGFMTLSGFGAAVVAFLAAMHDS